MSGPNQHPVVVTAQELVKAALGNPDIADGIYVCVWFDAHVGAMMARWATESFDVSEPIEPGNQPLLDVVLGAMSWPGACAFVQQVAGLLSMSHQPDSGWMPYDMDEGEGFAVAYVGDVTEIDEDMVWFAHGDGYLMHIIDTMGTLCGSEVDNTLRIWPMPVGAIEGDEFVPGRPICQQCLEVHRSRMEP